MLLSTLSMGLGTWSPSAMPSWLSFMAGMLKLWFAPLGARWPWDDGYCKAAGKSLVQSYSLLGKVPESRRALVSKNLSLLYGGTSSNLMDITSVMKSSSL